jgi:hypothetical protein
MAGLRQLLGELEANLKPEWLSPGYARALPLVRHAFNPVGTEVAAVAPPGNNQDMTLRVADQHPGALRAAAGSARRAQHACECTHTCMHGGSIRCRSEVTAAVQTGPV